MYFLIETVWQASVGGVRFESRTEGVLMRILSSGLDELEGA